MTHRPAGTTFANMSMPDARSAPLLSVCLGGLGGLVVHGDKLDRLPVLKAMVEAQEDMRGSACSAAETVIQVGVGVPENMSAAAVAEFLRRDPDDYVLDSVPEVAALQRRTLDWLGVDVSVLRTARELREESRVGEDMKRLATQLMLTIQASPGRPMYGGEHAWTNPETFVDLLPKLREEVSDFVEQMFSVECNPAGELCVSRDGEIIAEMMIAGFPWGMNPDGTWPTFMSLCPRWAQFM